MYLFLVRHFNDIDHIAPVVWKMNRDKYPAAVYCMNPRYDIHNDYRLQFLKIRGVTVDYLHDNTTLFEELGACWTINDEDELKNALLSLQTDKNDIPYSEEIVAAFVSDIVNGGDTDSDVLGRYEEFIINCAIAKQGPRSQPEARTAN